MQPIYYFLPMILLLGLFTSYEDVKKSKIRNKWIITAIIYSALVNSMLYFNDKINLEYLLLLILNAVLCLTFGFILWYFKFWSAGDAKLIFAYSTLIPLNTFFRGFIQFFPGVSIWINLAAISTIYLIIVLIIKSKKTAVFVALKNTFIPKEIVAFALFLFGISWIIKGLLGLLGISNLLIIVLFSMCISILILKNLKKKLNELIIAGIIFSILRIVIDKNALTLFSIAATAAALVIWLFFFRFFFNVSENIFVKKVGLNNVKIGQVVSKKFELNVKKHKITIEKSRKLSKKDVDLLKSIKIGKTRKNKFILIRDSMPFAPAVFASILVTIIVKGNILIYIKSLF